MTDNTLKSQAFKLKGRLYTFTVLSILNTDSKLLSQQLAEVIARAPRMFNQTPVVLDCSAINSDQIDLQVICQSVREQGLVPVAIQGGDPMLETLAQCQGMAVMNGSSTHDKPLFENPHEIQDTPVETPQADVVKNKLLTSPIRSGQQVVSRGDLIITSSVSHGAELLADGNIHVYGALRGRALAGIGGDKNARIFCQSLDAELVSIAGFYRLSDVIEPQTGPCQIFLKDDHIQIESL